MTDTCLIRGCVCTCVHLCSCPFTLSMCPSLIACLLALHARSIAVLDGSSLISIVLPLSPWGSSPLGRAPYSPIGLGSLSLLRGLEAVPLYSVSVIIGYTKAITHVWPLGFPWLELTHRASSCFCLGPICSHRSLLSSVLLYTG